MTEINEMDVMDGIELILKAYEKRAEERAFTLYASRYGWMDKESFIPFNEFHNPEKPVTENKSVEEILKEVENTLDTFKGRWKK